MVFVGANNAAGVGAGCALNSLPPFRGSAVRVSDDDDEDMLYAMRMPLAVRAACIVLVVW